MKLTETKGCFPAKFMSFGHRRASFTNLCFDRYFAQDSFPLGVTQDGRATQPNPCWKHGCSQDSSGLCPFCAAGPRAGDHAALRRTCSSISITCTVKNVFLVLSWGKTPLVPLCSLLALFPRSGLNTTILHNTLWPVLVDADNWEPAALLIFK